MHPQQVSNTKFGVKFQFPHWLCKHYTKTPVNLLKENTQNLMLAHPLCKCYIQISLDLRVYVRRIRNGFLKNHLLPKIQIKSLQIYTS